jgi:hypothetical protein
MKPSSSSRPPAIQTAVGLLACVVLLAWVPWRTTPASILSATQQLPCADQAAATPTCELEGTRYECGTEAFDWRYYTTHNKGLRRFSAVQAMHHWLDKGIAEGRRSHPGQRTLKILLMTMDEWPLLRSWVLYHAHLVGGHNMCAGWFGEGSGGAARSAPLLLRASVPACLLPASLDSCFQATHSSSPAATSLTAAPIPTPSPSWPRSSASWGCTSSAPPPS